MDFILDISEQGVESIILEIYYFLKMERISKVNTKSHLSIVASNLQSKISIIIDIFEGLLECPPTIGHWPEWVLRATALLSQYENISNDIHRQLNSSLIVPKHISFNSLADNSNYYFLIVN